MKIIFVGVHNKKGFAPLDSRSRSGKLIDKLILALQIELELFEADFVKSNTFDLEYWPAKEMLCPRSSVAEWAARVEYTGDDIVITLGQCVYEVFKHSNIEFIKLGHPSAVWSNESKIDYVSRAVGAVRKQLIKSKILK
jgi:hypothetical protein